MIEPSKVAKQITFREVVANSWLLIKRVYFDRNFILIVVTITEKSNAVFILAK